MSRLRNRRSERFTDGEDINPMSYLSNLSDVMLILAVGIMLALVLHWNVQLSSAEGDGQVTEAYSDREIDTDQALEVTEEQLENVEGNPVEDASSQNMKELGAVYYDADTGKYYIVEHQNSGE